MYPCSALSLLPLPLCHLICPWSPVAYLVLSIPALPRSGDVEEDRLVQKGTELWRSWKGLSAARTAGEPPSASWEWGDAVQLRLQPDLPRQQLPTVPVENRSSSVPA